MAEGKSTRGIWIGVGLVAIGVIVAWFWLGDSEMGESPVDEAAGANEIGDEQEGDIND